MSTVANERIARFSWRTASFLIRVVIGTWLALVAIMAAHMAWLQSRPASAFVDLKNIKVDMDGDVAMVHIERQVMQDSDVVVAAELRSVDNPGFQPCIQGFRSIADSDGTPVVHTPLDSVFSNCNLERLSRRNENLTLQLVYTVELDYGIRKRAAGQSEPFKLPVK